MGGKPPALRSSAAGSGGCPHEIGANHGRPTRSTISQSGPAAPRLFQQRQGDPDSSAHGRARCGGLDQRDVGVRPRLWIRVRSALARRLARPRAAYAGAGRRPHRAHDQARGDRARRHSGSAGQGRDHPQGGDGGSAAAAREGAGVAQPGGHALDRCNHRSYCNREVARGADCPCRDGEQAHRTGFGGYRRSAQSGSAQKGRRLD